MHFPVELPKHILDLAAAHSIRPEDIEEHHTHGGGHGGQNLNKSTNCVELTHHPTGIAVRYQHHRHLLRNRIEAYSLIMEKIAEQKKKQEQEEHEREFLAKHPMGWERTPEGKTRTVEEKKHHGDKKRHRGEPIAAPEERPPAV